MLISFFFFKQKTAYELRISDWSSDVCSSDLDVPIVDRHVDLGGERLQVALNRTVRRRYRFRVQDRTLGARLDCTKKRSWLNGPCFPCQKMADRKSVV